ncbi:hypothetical protein PUN28_013997 [Cardiocondyla obscurior]|uniref:Uncharacterized protein n=1 Tax=Cardiocondyla obscurior TaxID=286306 RepID=A0AAW2F9W9_9HYME
MLCHNESCCTCLCNTSLNCHSGRWFSIWETFRVNTSSGSAIFSGHPITDNHICIVTCRKFHFYSYNSYNARILLSQYKKTQ